jgi:hypothetical protein
MSETPHTPGPELQPPPNSASPAWWRRNMLVLVLSVLVLTLAVCSHARGDFLRFFIGPPRRDGLGIFKSGYPHARP